jgi:hypothetical protein
MCVVHQRQKMFPVGPGNTHHLADNTQRDPGGDVGDEVARLVLEGAQDRASGGISYFCLDGTYRSQGEPVVNYCPELMVKRQVGRRQGSPSGLADVGWAHACLVYVVLLRPQQGSAG